MLREDFYEAVNVQTRIDILQELQLTIQREVEAYFDDQIDLCSKTDFINHDTINYLMKEQKSIIDFATRYFARMQKELNEQFRAIWGLKNSIA